MKIYKYTDYMHKLLSPVERVYEVQEEVRDSETPIGSRKCSVLCFSGFVRAVARRKNEREQLGLGERTPEEPE